jgi:hypothetical protein
MHTLNRLPPMSKPELAQRYWGEIRRGLVLNRKRLWVRIPPREAKPLLGFRSRHTSMLPARAWGWAVSFLQFSPISILAYWLAAVLPHIANLDQARSQYRYTYLRVCYLVAERLLSP